MNIKLLMAVLVFAVGLSATRAQGQAKNDEEASQDRSAIKSAIESYEAAFNSKNIDNLLEHWSADGVYVSRSTSEKVAGHEALKNEFKVVFSSGNSPRMKLNTDRIEFISPNVALETGSAIITRSADDVVEVDYQVIFVRSGEKWLIDRVTDEELKIPASNRPKLARLEWLIGNWVDEGDGFSIEIDCSWTKNQNYISRTYRVQSEGDVTSSGVQIIGWDPVNQSIRSWLFDSDGGYVSGRWTESDGAWVVQSRVILADGTVGSFASVFKPLESGKYSWKKINRVLDGKILPNIDEVVVKQR